MVSNYFFKGSNLLLTALVAQAVAVVGVGTTSPIHRRMPLSYMSKANKSFSQQSSALPHYKGLDSVDDKKSAALQRISVHDLDFLESGLRVKQDMIAQNSNFLPSTQLPELSRVSGIRKDVVTVREGESPIRLFSQRGLSSQVASEVAHLLLVTGAEKSVLKEGELIEFIRSSFTNEILEVRRPLVTGGAIVAKRLRNNRFVRQELNLQPVTREYRSAGIIFSSLASAAAQQEIPYEIIDDFVDLFSDRIDFRRDLQRGDSFSIVYSQSTDALGRVSSVGPILAASMRSGGKLQVAVRHVGRDGKARYFDEKGKTGGAGFLRYPLKFSRISSVFSDSRFHPVLQRWRPHNGVDFAAPIGTPVRSVGDGIITHSGYNGAGGITVKIKHSERFTTAYLHLSQVERGLRPGMRVSRGDQIGRVGMTGRSTGPHLHFSLYDNGKYVDPFKSTPLFMVEEENLIPKDILVAQLRELEEQHHALAKLDIPEATS
jgi:murein DD-endopeptidase MepM/ murein hydrolase activator NlpD